jgi:hypothetical protein
MGCRLAVVVNCRGGPSPSISQPACYATPHSAHRLDHFAGVFGRNRPSRYQYCRRVRAQLQAGPPIAWASELLAKR